MKEGIRMNYISVIKTSFYFFPIIALIITIPFIIRNYRRYGSVHKLRTIIVYSFILYLLTIYFLVIMPLPSIEEVAQLTTPKINLIPFSFITDFIKETPLIITEPNTYLLALKDSSFYVVIFNIIMTIPFGMYLRYYYKCSLKKTIFLSFLLSLFFEITQLTGLYFIYPRSYRLFDIDDLILNTLGGLLGYFIMGKINKYLPTREKIDQESYTNGEIVSPLRRLMIALIDIIFYFFFIILLSIFIQNYLLLISFILYYIIIPLIWDGKTIGSNFLKVKRNFNKRKLLNTFLYPIFKLVYYLIMPNLALYIVIFLLAKINHFITFVILVGFIFLYLSFYLGNIIFLFISKTMFYDSLFSLEYQSTITKRWENLPNNNECV